MKKAFTLIELLLTIAIIAILVGILLPSLAKSKEAANKPLCENNLRQFGIALTAYSHDYKQLPLLTMAESMGDFVSNFHAKIEGYSNFAPPSKTVSTKPWTCASDRSPAFWKSSGSSYHFRYIASFNGNLNYWEQFRHRRQALIAEFAPFHREGNKTNRLYVDGSTKFTDEPLSSDP